MVSQLVELFLGISRSFAELPLQTRNIGIIFGDFVECAFTPNFGDLNYFGRMDARQARFSVFFLDSLVIFPHRPKILVVVL
jgi:hypothetical protein